MSLNYQWWHTIFNTPPNTEQLPKNEGMSSKSSKTGDWEILVSKALLSSAQNQEQKDNNRLESEVVPRVKALMGHTWWCERILEFNPWDPQAENRLSWVVSSYPPGSARVLLTVRFPALHPQNKVVMYPLNSSLMRQRKARPLVDRHLSLLGERWRSARNPAPKDKSKTKPKSGQCQGPQICTDVCTYLYLNVEGHLHAEIYTHVCTYICIWKWKDTHTHAL